MTRILFVVRKLDVGGMERLVIALIDGLDRQRYYPILCTIEDAGQLAPELCAAGVEVVSIDKGPGLSFQSARSLRRLYTDLNIDLIHTHNSTAHFYAAIARQLMLQKPPLIHTKHGRGSPEVRKSVILNALCSRLSDRVVAVSRDVEQVCREVEKVPAKKLRTIINGIDLTPFVALTREDKASSKLVLGHVGRLYEVKNQALLLRVFQRFLSEYPDSKLVLVGDGPMRAELQKLADDLGIEKSVVFHGYRSDIPELMAGFDCFVMSSLSEGTPLVVIEAMAARCPVIGTDVGGMKEIVDHGRTGYLVPSEDEDAMLACWLELAANPDRRRNMGIEGQAVANSTYRLDIMVEQYQKLYESLL